MSTRISGFSGSGLDIDGIVKGLMQAQITSDAVVSQKRTRIQWKKEDYNSLRIAANNFSTMANTYKLSITTKPIIVNSSNTAVATAIASGGDAANTNHSITVTQLAEGVKISSSGALGNNAQKDTLANQFGLAPNAKFNVKIGNGTQSQTIIVDTSKSIYNLADQINKSGVNVSANYDSTLDRFYISTPNTGASAGIDFSGSDALGSTFLTNSLKIPTVNQATTAGTTSSKNIGVTNAYDTLANLFGVTGSFNLKITNGTNTSNLTINATDTLNTVISNINAAAGVNASASYNSVTGMFSLKALSGKLGFSGSDANTYDFLSNDLKLSQNGQDAKLTINGNSMSHSSNPFKFDEITYNLQGLGSTNVEVSTDVDKIVTNVKSFVESYNKMIDTLNVKIKESKYRDYLPLTDEQKSQMKESDITLWQAKARSGLFNNDPIMTKLVDDMRISLSAPVSGVTGAYNSASSIGITTGAYQERGKIYLDENNLKIALSADPDAVSKVISTFDTSNTAINYQGVATRLNSAMQTAAKVIQTQAGSSASVDTASNLGKEWTAYNKKISALLIRAQEMQANYYKIYGSLDAALTKLGQQSSWLSQQLGAK